MIARIGGVAVDVEVVEVERRTGIWCDQCALPSIVELDQNIVAVATLQPFARQTWRYCTEQLERYAHGEGCRVTVWERR